VTAALGANANLKKALKGRYKKDKIYFALSGLELSGRCDPGRRSLRSLYPGLCNFCLSGKGKKNSFVL